MMFSHLRQMLQQGAGSTVSGGCEYIIAGLGNPGKQYELTRHNAGFLAVEAIARKHGVSIDRIKYKSLCASAEIGGRRVLLLKPQTFMNLSGEALREAVSFFKIPMDRVLVIYDDISLPVGRLRVRLKGSDGGHNGIKSVISLSGSDAFPRIKIGVGQKPRPDYDLAAWVTGKFPPADLKALPDVLDRACAAAELIVAGNAAEAMNLYNG